MDSRDIIKIGDRAKNETEAFINRHLCDRAKGWPTNHLYGPNYADWFVFCAVCTLTEIQPKIRRGL